MADTFVEVSSATEGTTINLPFTPTEEERANVHVYADGVEVTDDYYEWSADAQLTLLEDFPANTVTRVERETPVDDDEKVTQDGSTVYDFEGVNTNFNIIFKSLQELRDKVADSLKHGPEVTIAAGKSVVMGVSGRFEEGPDADQIADAEEYAERAEAAALTSDVTNALQSSSAISYFVGKNDDNHVVKWKQRWVDLWAFNPIGDGTSHHLSERFASLAAAQAVYPSAQALTDEIDQCALESAIAAARAMGGAKIDMGAGWFACNRTLLINSSNIWLMGHGKGGSSSCDLFTRLGNIASATAIWWSGVDSIGSRLLVIKPDDASDKLLFGNQVTSLGLIGRRGDAGNVVGITLEVRSVFAGNFDVFVDGGQDKAVYLSVVDDWSHPPTGSPVGTSYRTYYDPSDMQMCKFRFYINQQWGTKEGYGLVMGGNFWANVSENVFEDVQYAHINKAGIVVGGADSNTFHNVRGYRHPSGTAYGVRLSAGADTRRCSRANIFHSFYPGDGGVYAEGTEVAATASFSNTIHNYNRDNAAPDPVIGTGATLTVYNDNGKVQYTDVYWERASASLQKLTGGLQVTGGIKMGSYQMEQGFTSYTPAAVTANSGTITTASVTGRYFRIGKTVWFMVNITVTTNGTGASYLKTSLPFTPKTGYGMVGSGANISSGWGVFCNWSAGSNVLNIRRADATYPITADGQVVQCWGVFETDDA